MSSSVYEPSCRDAKRRGIAAAAILPIVLGATIMPEVSQSAQQAAMTAAESDPGKLGWMIGTPPPRDKIIRFTDSDYFAFPKIRWTVCHFRQLMPTVGVARGSGAAVPFKRKLDASIDEVTFTPSDTDRQMTWAQSLQANYTDGIVVLHDGVVVYERYAGCLNESGQHAAMSVTKSLTGQLGELLVVEGVIDETAKVDTIIPELTDSAFGDATVKQVLEMTTGLRYSEDYADPDAEVWQYSQAGSPLPKPAGYTGPRSYFEYLQTVKKEGVHGRAFAYKTVNTDALGWIIARKTGRSVSDLLAERIWSKLGAEQDAYYTVDSSGAPYAGGGFSSGLRDLARIGQLILEGGTINGTRLIPQAAIQRIRAEGDKEAFARAGYANLKGWSYRGMWWITHNEHGAFMARGVHGQSLYIDPAAHMVIARFASHPTASNTANDPTTLPAFHAVAKHLMARP